MAKPEEFHTLDIGHEIKIYYNPDNINNRLYHVRGFVDGRLILRTWYRSKNRWEYIIWQEIEWIVFCPYITIIRRKESKLK